MTETASALIQQLKSKKVTATEILEQVIDEIESKDKAISAFLTKTYDLAERFATGSFAVPIALKDNLCLKHVKTTCGSNILKDFVPPYTATAVHRLMQAGLPIVGKTNMDEFAMGSSCEHSAFFATRNPWDLSRVPGGSSGGSAAAVASGMVPWALGSDTGGSIRQPASLCGVVGLKPTYGRISRYGLVAFASSLDQIGPITLCVQDAALLLNWLAGHDPKDSTTIRVSEAEDFSPVPTDSLKGIRIGLLSDMLEEGVEEGVRERVKEAALKLEEIGASVEETAFSMMEEALAAYYILAPSECSSNLARYDGMLFGSRKEAADMLDSMIHTRDAGFGREVKRRIMIGTYCLSSGYYDAYYLKAQKVRTLVCQAFEQLFRKYDILLSPTAPTVAFKLGEKLEDPVAMYASDKCTIPVSMAGICAISVPCGLSQNLPVGLQLIAGPLQERKLLQVAYVYEQVRGAFLAPEVISQMRSAEHPS